MTAPSVLIIEDDAALRALETRLAERAGFDVRCAANGRAGLEAALARPPDVVVSDFHMPGVSGPALLRKLRELPKMQQSTILVVTGDRSDSIRQRLVAAGADQVLTKPFPPADFQRQLIDAAQSRGLEPVPRRRARRPRTPAASSKSPPSVPSAGMMLVFAAALERPGRERLEAVRNHIERVRELSALLATAAGAAPDMVDQLKAYAGLHDVGKSGLPDRLLHKEGAFSPTDRQELEAHVLLGADLLQDAGLPEVAVQIARHHHERWDGRGYPHRLAGERIPYAARVVAVVDVYDALRSARPSRPALDATQADARLRAGAGTHFDPALVDCFLKQASAIEAIYARHADPGPELDIEAWR